MTIELDAALCLALWDGFDNGIEGGVMKLCDRRRLIPVSFDIQEKSLR